MQGFNPPRSKYIIGILTIIALLIVSCTQIYDNNSTVQAPRSTVPLIADNSPLASMVLTEQDIKNIPSCLPKDHREVVYSVVDEWLGSGALEAVETWLGGHPCPYFVAQRVVRFPNARIAMRAWENAQDKPIDPVDQPQSKVDLLSYAVMPQLHADHVFLVCEDYGYGYPNCAVRLQYGNIYTELRAELMRPDGLTPEAYYQLLSVLDERMQLIWEKP